MTAGLDTSPWLFGASAGLVSATSGALTLGVYYDMQASPSGYLNQVGSAQLKLRL